MKKSTAFWPNTALTSQSSPPWVCPLSPATTDMSVASPPNWGVNPPGNISWKVKQLGSSKTRWSATGSGTWSVIVTTGQSADPSSTPSCASNTSPTSSVWPPSMLKTPARVFGFR